MSNIHGKLKAKKWSVWTEELGSGSPQPGEPGGGRSAPNTRGPSPLPPTDDVMKLNRDDMHTYGECPSWDSFVLVKCEKCGRIVKIEALESHATLRHGSKSERMAYTKVIAAKAAQALKAGQVRLTPSSSSGSGVSSRGGLEDHLDELDSGKKLTFRSSSDRPLPPDILISGSSSSTSPQPGPFHHHHHPTASPPLTFRTNSMSLPPSPPTPSRSGGGSGGPSIQPADSASAPDTRSPTPSPRHTPLPGEAEEMDEEEEEEEEAMEVDTLLPDDDDETSVDMQTSSSRPVSSSYGDAATAGGSKASSTSLSRRRSVAGGNRGAESGSTSSSMRYMGDEADSTTHNVISIPDTDDIPNIEIGIISEGQVFDSINTKYNVSLLKSDAAAGGASGGGGVDSTTTTASVNKNGTRQIVVSQQPSAVPAAAGTTTTATGAAASVKLGGQGGSFTANRQLLHHHQQQQQQPVGSSGGAPEFRPVVCTTSSGITTSGGLNITPMTAGIAASTGGPAAAAAGQNLANITPGQPRMISLPMRSSVQQQQQLHHQNQQHHQQHQQQLEKMDVDHGAVPTHYITVSPLSKPSTKKPPVVIPAGKSGHGGSSLTTVVVGEKKVTGREREYDPNKHCGVWDADAKRNCTRSLTCKSHSVYLKRKVLNRSGPFDELLAAHKAEKELAAKMSENPQGIVVTTAAVETAESHQSILARRLQGSTTTGPGKVWEQDVVRQLQQQQQQTSVLKQPNTTVKRTFFPQPTVSAREVYCDENLHFSTDHPKPLAVCTFGGKRIGSLFLADRSRLLTRKVMKIAIANSGIRLQSVMKAESGNLLHHRHHLVSGGGGGLVGGGGGVKRVTGLVTTSPVVASSSSSSLLPPRLQQQQQSNLPYIVNLQGGGGGVGTGGVTRGLSISGGGAGSRVGATLQLAPSGGLQAGGSGSGPHFVVQDSFKTDIQDFKGGIKFQLGRNIHHHQILPSPDTGTST